MSTKITKKDLEEMEVKMEAKIVSALQNTIREENQRLLLNFQEEINNVRSEVEQVRSQIENVEDEVDRAIIAEYDERESKKKEIYFRGMTMERALEVIENILTEAPNVRFKKAFMYNDVQNSGIIGLNLEQCNRLLKNKAEYMKNNDLMKHCSIQQAMTRRQARVRKILLDELKSKEAPPTGSKYIIRNAEVVLVKNRASSTHDAKNGHA